MAKLYRYRPNGKLYWLYHVQPRTHVGSHYEAHPFNHSDMIGRKRAYAPATRSGVMFTHGMTLDDFEVVAEVTPI